ncbi:MAG: thiamine-phosphate kinase [Candidatus Saganbacteria bacterium]|nr:thiamine-phosphate kinase [Candidatus Saganbacteria bacterium]
MKLKNLGEFGLIERIKKSFKPSPRVYVGIGDDSAVIKLSGNKCLLISTDTLVENIHFKLKYSTFYQLGWKLLAGGISDISAMGGTPTDVLITLGLPADLPVKAVDDIYRGIKSVARKFNIGVIGGDTVSSKDIFLTVTALGIINKKELLLRSKARVGDAILVTGELGASGAGLKILKSRESPVASRELKWVIKKHLMPDPRVVEGKIIGKLGKATSMIDFSDGLAAGCFEIAKRSNVGIRIWKNSLPIGEGTKSASEVLKISPFDLALYGGEDYELMFTVPRSEAVSFVERFKKKSKTRISIIGEVVGRGRGIKIVDLKGKVHPFRGKGYEHFKE